MRARPVKIRIHGKSQACALLRMHRFVNRRIPKSLNGHPVQVVTSAERTLPAVLHQTSRFLILESWDMWGRIFVPLRDVQQVQDDDVWHHGLPLTGADRGRCPDLGRNRLW